MRQPGSTLQLVGSGVGVRQGVTAASPIAVTYFAGSSADHHQEPVTFSTAMGCFALLSIVLGAALVCAAILIRRLLVRCRELHERLFETKQIVEQQALERLRALMKANERLSAEVSELRLTEVRLRNAQLTLEESSQKYAQSSYVDSLTNLANRRKFDELLETEWRRGVRSRMPIALVLVDVDYFKLFNDTYGHGAGDDCLHDVAAVVAAAARRPGDLAARIEGEEFALLLCETAIEGAMSVASQIQSAIEELAIAHETTKVFDTDIVTVSIGVASMLPESTIGPNVLLYRAEEALYAAKQGGRNCIRSYDSWSNERRSQSTLRAARSGIPNESLGRHTK